jgi:pyruvate dehydrogenase E1 component
MNENYQQPIREGVEEGILRGMYLSSGSGKKKPPVQLLGSGSILREVLAGADPSGDFGVASDVWGVPSFTELRREGLEAERWNRLHPTEEPRRSWVETSLAGRAGPFVAATDYMRTFADQIRPFVPGRYAVLGTDGFGRSDYRVKLRSFFEVDRHRCRAALKALADVGGSSVPSSRMIERYGIDAEPRRPEALTQPTNDPQGRAGKRFALRLSQRTLARRAGRQI